MGSRSQAILLAQIDDCNVDRLNVGDAWDKGLERGEGSAKVPMSIRRVSTLHMRSL